MCNQEKSQIVAVLLLVLLHNILLMEFVKASH
jgi:hypothetical protein